MFICQQCGVVNGPKVSPTMTVVETRPKTYDVKNYDEEGEFTHFSTVVGSEIVKEKRVCPPCLGIEVKTPAPVDHRMHFGVISALQGHGRSCKERLIVDCRVCLRALETYKSIPAQSLSLNLSQPQAETFKVSMAAMVVESILWRAGHKSKRAENDFNTAFPLMKAYEGRGGSL